MSKVPKSKVGYRRSKGVRKCGNCSMFRPVSGGIGGCTLVAGMIRSQDVCDRWTAKKA